MFELLQRLDGGEMLGLVAILGGVLIALFGIVMGTWYSMHWASHQNALKREMLARGMSVDEIERLTLTEAERLCKLKGDRKAREAEIAADLKRETIVRGVPIEQAQQPAPCTDAQIEEESKALADTIVRMVHDGELDRNVVARLISTFIKRGGRHRDWTNVTVNSA